MFKNASLKVGVMLTGAVALVVLGASGAFATSTDPTGGAAESTLTAATDWITTHGAPLVVGLLVVGIIFGILVKFARRGARAA
jgi:hypothetical protein